MIVKILGSGCTKCRNLEQRLLEIRSKNNLDFEIEKISRLEDIMDYGVMMTPGLVIDGEIKSVGRVPNEADLLNWLKEG
ncbi:MAG: thioredoxin family protein [Calditrichales bacterium]|nr:MAG: thioredoxin family protein [Calditrichales bacterium]